MDNIILLQCIAPMLGGLIGTLIGTLIVVLWIRLIIPKGQDLWDWIRNRHEERHQRLCVERYEQKRQAYLKEREERKALTEDINDH